MANEDNNNPQTSRSGNAPVGRRTFLGAAGAGAVTTTLAGCLGGVDSGGDDGVFKIGHLGPTELQMGRGAERSAELAVAELNENGGIQGQDVELLSEDTGGQVSEAERVTENLVGSDQVDLLVGTFVSEVTQGIMDYVAERNVPFVITGSADPATITERHGQDYEKYKNIVRTGPINSDLQAEGMANYASYLNDLHGFENFSILADDAAWTGSFREILPDAIEENGDLSVVYEDRMPLGEDNFNPYMDEAAANDTDAVLRFIAHGGAATFSSTWAQNEYPFAVEGISVPGMSPEFLAATEGAAMYETTSQSGAGGVSELTEQTMPFVEAYDEEYGGEEPPSKPMYMGFNSYDGILFYANAVEEADTIDYNSDLDSIVDAMLGLEFTGAAGKISLYGKDSEYPNDLKETRDDDGIISNFPVTQWQPDGDGGVVECVYPETYATADHIVPEWI
ncbi:ABC transporter substrate-binding protein [Natrinema salaciae]|uniref:Amino acid/amide ABC transporter substrate-binding protein, HAAT family n=1 Tax=Natrinema salaciae TaxID=1186196 RepID=A0A1H9R6X6_9EURY|nr:ABC transporter substrate-binding protein [Natrinema salaciae]SER68448.1 amino acid/amide ABC transporter substrate-binding protein, HAAT family [Natrinema salaciae]